MNPGDELNLERDHRDGTKSRSERTVERQAHASCRFMLRDSDFVFGCRRLTLRGMHDPIGRLKTLIRDIPDFPKPGILFRDITPLLADPRGWRCRSSCWPTRSAGRTSTWSSAPRAAGSSSAPPSRAAISAGFQVVRKPRQAAAQGRVDELRPGIRHGHAGDARRRHRARASAC